MHEQQNHLKPFSQVLQRHCSVERLTIKMSTGTRDLKREIEREKSRFVRMIAHLSREDCSSRDRVEGCRKQTIADNENYS